MTVREFFNSANSSSPDYITLLEENTWENMVFVKDTMSKPDGVLVISKGSYPYRRIYQGGANVKWWGAWGNGIADDTVAIQRALDTCEDVFIPRGTYLVLGLLASKKGMRIHGEYGSVLYAGNVQEYVLEVRCKENTTDLVEDVHIYDLKINGAGRGKVGLRCNIINGVVERLEISGCTSIGLLHHRGFTSTYREVKCSFNKTGVKVFQEGNLLLFERCVFSTNAGNGVLYHSGTTTMFLSCSIEHNGGNGIQLSYQQEKKIKYPPYVETTTGMITILSCFFENNGEKNKECSGIHIQGQDDGPLKVFNVAIKGCHFGFERAIHAHSNIRGLSIEDSWINKGKVITTPIRLGSFALDTLQRNEATISLKGNTMELEDIEVTGATPEFNAFISKELRGIKQDIIPN